MIMQRALFIKMPKMFLLGDLYSTFTGEELTFLFPYSYNIP